MIYSRFGTKLTPLSKRQDAGGHISIQAIADLTADNGLGEINDAVDKLAWHVAASIAPPREQHRRRRTT
jgi:hypothetical protein